MRLVREVLQVPPQVSSGHGLRFVFDIVFLDTFLRNALLPRSVVGGVIRMDGGVVLETCGGGRSGPGP